MSKKDYIKVANILANAPLDQETRTVMAVQFAEFFEDDNSAFNSERFYAAVGV